jgi:exonuclease III
MRFSSFGLAGLAALSACTPFTAGQAPREARPFEAADIDPDTLRFVTWNINTIGAPGDTEYEAMLDVVGRLQPDVLALNEIEDDEDALFMETLATVAGYEHIVSADHVGFGNDRNAILSRYPLTGYGAFLSDDVGEELHQGWDSPSLSGQSDAKDIARALTAAVVHAPGGDVGVLSAHWKSGGSDNDTEFRRAVETVRTLQAVDEFGDLERVIVSGDLNVDVFDNTPTPTAFYALPSGFPARYELGADIEAMLPGGLTNHPHQMLADFGLTMHEALQADGFPGTRPESGRVLDYVYSNGMAATGSEVYNSIFDDTVSGLEKAGTPLDTFACAETSDHLPVVVDFALADTSGPTVLGVDDLVAGDLVVTELLANPVDCADSIGEWIEVRNDSGFAIDLGGIVVEDASGNGGALDPLVLAIGGRAVLANNASACNVVVDGVYPSMTLNNSGDDVLLLGSAGVVIDQVSYPAAGGEAGLSWSVDDTGAWCAGPPTAGGVNASCDGGGTVTPPPPTPPAPTPPPGPTLLTVADLVAGDLLVTEVMANPENCSDSTGEWIELENTSGADVQLDGLVIEDATGNSGAIGPVVVGPGGHVVLARSAAACDVTVDGVYGSSVSWNNGGDDILVYAGTTLVDSVSYGAAGGAAGLSWAVDGSGAWCAGPATAGAANPICN